jgi:hypothetical protein
MQDAKVFEKQAKPAFSKTCGRWLRLRHTNLLSAESKLVLDPQVGHLCTLRNTPSSPRRTFQGRHEKRLDLGTAIA